MKRSPRPLLPLLLLVLPAAVPATEMQDEISHLLQFVESTTCQYERNGDLHTGTEAVEHIRRKFEHFRDRIDSAEKFIELAATKSTISGRYYVVHCAGQPEVTSRDWLLRELKRYRYADN